MSRFDSKSRSGRASKHKHIDFSSNSRHAKKHGYGKSIYSSKNNRKASHGKNIASIDFSSNERRFAFIVGVFIIFALVCFVRLFLLQVVFAPAYNAESEVARTSYLSIEPRRGTIYDRNGIVLATSVDATTIYVDPTEVTDVNLTAGILAQVLGGKASDYLEKVVASNTRYSVISRKVDVSVGENLEDVATEKVAEKQEEYDKEAKYNNQTADTVLSGIHLVSESRREYPCGQVGGQVVGACNTEVDSYLNREYYVGICGLEAQYDSELSGTPGYYEAEYGRSGQAIPGGVHKEVAAVDGEDIVVSIDIEMQRQLEEALSQGCANMGVDKGSSVLMDGSTGEIYAAASLPLFNPADRTEVKEGALQLKCVTDLFEPGSIFKSVSAMSILETNTMTPETELFCPSSITADGYTITDAHERGDATYTLREILDQSSNIGISLAVENMGFDKLYEHILRYNLHSRTGVDFPGEGEAGTDVLGMLIDFDTWSRVQGYNVSFGQGISVTPLQMVRFYGALVNNGVECTPHFLLRKVKANEKPTYATQDVIENKSAIADMQSMLQTVVTDGTGTEAAIDGYNVAGKTSTAEIYDEENGGYRDGVYNLAFTGFIANSSSKLVCFVGANEVPSDGVVTPIFKDIMTSAIENYAITSY